MIHSPASLFAYVMLLIDFAALIAGVFALADAAVRKPPAYQVVGRGRKALWVGILAAAVAVSLLGAGVFSILGLAGLVASIVYLVDMRPKLRALGGSRRGGSGPYGPW